MRQRPHRPVQLRAQGLGEHVAQQLPGLGRGPHGAAGQLRAQLLGDFDRHLGTEVGLQQRGLDVLPGVLVQLAGAEQAEQALPEPGTGAGQPAAQPLQAALRRFDLLDACGWSGGCGAVAGVRDGARGRLVQDCGVPAGLGVVGSTGAAAAGGSVQTGASAGVVPAAVGSGAVGSGAVGSGAVGSGAVGSAVTGSVGVTAAAAGAADSAAGGWPRRGGAMAAGGWLRRGGALGLVRLLRRRRLPGCPGHGGRAPARRRPGHPDHGEAGRRCRRLARRTEVVGAVGSAGAGSGRVDGGSGGESVTAPEVKSNV